MIRDGKIYLDDVLPALMTAAGMVRGDGPDRKALHLALAAGGRDFGYSTVANAVSGARPVSVEFCLAVARVFGVTLAAILPVGDGAEVVGTVNPHGEITMSAQLPGLFQLEGGDLRGLAPNGSLLYCVAIRRLDGEGWYVIARHGRHELVAWDGSALRTMDGLTFSDLPEIVGVLREIRRVPLRVAEFFS